MHRTFNEQYTLKKKKKIIDPETGGWESVQGLYRGRYRTAEKDYDIAEAGYPHRYDTGSF